MSSPQSQQLPVLRVTAKDCGAGFFALMIYAINQIIWAEKNGYVSVVDFGERCRDHRLNRYYDAAHGPNVWEYYFHPISAGAIASPTSFQLTTKQLFNLHHISPDSVQTYPHGVHRALKVPKWRYSEVWHRTMRSRASSLLQRLVRLKPEPLSVVRSFYHDKILSLGTDRPALGLHLRGTDKLRNIGGRIVQPEEYHPLIRRYLEKRPNAILLIATDSPAFLAQMRAAYGDRLVAYDALRSERNAFADKRIANNYKKGEDALVDSLLLSCANFLIKPASALSEFSVYFNGDLHNHTYELQYEVGIPDASTAFDAHFSSSRDKLRGFARCAPIMRPA